MPEAKDPPFGKNTREIKRGGVKTPPLSLFARLNAASVAAPQRMTMVVTDMGEITRSFLNAPSYSVLRSQFSFVTVTVMFV